MIIKMGYKAVNETVLAVTKRPAKTKNGIIISDKEVSKPEDTIEFEITSVGKAVAENSDLKVGDKFAVVPYKGYFDGKVVETKMDDEAGMLYMLLKFNYREIEMLIDDEQEGK